MAKRLAASESGFGRARHAGNLGAPGPLWADLGDVGEHAAQLVLAAAMRA